jgi:fructose-specific phosphotransferase system component IIB
VRSRPSAAQIKRAAELAKQLGVSIKIEPDGSVTIAPAPEAKQVDAVREFAL